MLKEKTISPDFIIRYFQQFPGEIFIGFNFKSQPVR